MQTKMLVKKPEPDSGRTNNPVNNNHKNKPAENKKNVRTTDYKKLLQMMLNDPDAITREEFLFLQSIIGYRQAVAAREKAKLRKQQRKIDQTNVVMKPVLLERSNSEIGKDSDGKKEDTSSKDNSTKTPIQMKKDDGNTSASSSSMQHNLKSGLEKLSGVDLSDAKVHQNSDKPQQVGALAYTQGNDIYVAPGQEKYLPHEGWHAVQQKQRRVNPTMQMKTGALVNDNAGLEKEADVMGNKAVTEGSKSDIMQLKKFPKINNAQSKQNVIQRAKAAVDEIKQAYYGETSDNVKKIQRVLIAFNYWTGKRGDTPTGYFGDITKNSLISFQKNNMKLQEKDLYDNKGNYVGCGPKTAEKLNIIFKNLYCNNLPGEAINSIINTEGKSTVEINKMGNLTENDVAVIQTSLYEKGYWLGPFDGKLGSSSNMWSAIAILSNRQTYYNTKHSDKLTVGKVDIKTWKALGLTCDSNGQVVRSSTLYKKYLDEAKTLGYGQSQIAFQVTDIGLNSISVNVSNPNKKTIKIYDEKGYPQDKSEGTLIKSHRFDLNDGKYTFDGLKEGHNYGIAVFDSQGHRLMLEQGIFTNYTCGKEVAMPYAEYNKTYGQKVRPKAWGEANKTRAEMSEFQCSQDVFVNYGLSDINNDGIKDHESLDLWPSLINVKSYYFKRLGFSVYECPFKPGYFSSDSHGALLGKKQCFIKQGSNKPCSTLKDLDSLDYDHRFDIVGDTAYSVSKIYISAAADIITVCTLYEGAAEAQGAKAVLLAVLKGLAPSKWTTAATFITSIEDRVYKGTLPWNDLGTWAKDYLIPFCGTYDAIKEASAVKGPINGVFLGIN